MHHVCDGGIHKVHRIQGFVFRAFRYTYVEYPKAASRSVHIYYLYYLP